MAILSFPPKREDAFGGIGRRCETPRGEDQARRLTAKHARDGVSKDMSPAHSPSRSDAGTFNLGSHRQATSVFRVVHAGLL